MMIQGMFMLFLSLALGYALCVSASKQKGNLRTLGNTLGISIIVLSFLFGLLVSEMPHYMKGKMNCPCCKMAKSGTMTNICPMMKTH